MIFVSRARGESSKGWVDGEAESEKTGEKTRRGAPVVLVFY